MSPAERNEHVLALAQELGASIITDDKTVRSVEGYHDDPDPLGIAWHDAPWEGAPKFKLVMLTTEPGSSKLAYLVALHELGHLLEDCDATQCSEATAWRWAMEQAQEPIDAEDWGNIASYLRTYVNEDFNRLLVEAERKAAS